MKNLSPNESGAEVLFYPLQTAAVVIHQVQAKLNLNWHTLIRVGLYEEIHSKEG